MCRRIRCEDCQKPSFAGCGMHVESVLKDVPPEARCTCPATLERLAKATSSQPTAASPYASAAANQSGACAVKPAAASNPPSANQVGSAYASAPQKRPAPAKPQQPAPSTNASSQ